LLSVLEIIPASFSSCNVAFQFMFASFEKSKLIYCSNFSDSFISSYILWIQICYSNAQSYRPFF
jgi:hypothetical protein